MNKTPQTLVEAVRYFSDPDRAREYLASRRWPNGIVCPHCKGNKVGFITTRKIYKCKLCRKQFSVKTGTIMEDSALGLDKWLSAMWLVANCRNGISSYEIARDLGIEQRSAWFMLHRIRAAMEAKTFEKMKGTIEIDETFCGGLVQNMHKDTVQRRVHDKPYRGKLPVFGMHSTDEQGNTEVRAETVPTIKGKDLLPRVSVNAQWGSEIHTDEAVVYFYLGPEYSHKVINHGDCYVGRDGRTINRIENFWSVLKRGLKGSYIRPNGPHLNRYVQEAVFRINVKKESDADRFTKLVDGVSGKRLTYAQLTKKPTEQ